MSTVTPILACSGISFGRRREKPSDQSKNRKRHQNNKTSRATAHMLSVCTSDAVQALFFIFRQLQNVGNGYVYPLDKDEPAGF